MSDVNQTQDYLQQTGQKPKLPGSLNVLTILTFIGCGIGLLFTALMPKLMSWSLSMMDKASQQGNLTEKQLIEMEKGKIAMEKVIANQWPVLITGLIGIALCLYGAIQMRKLKKEGFYMYVVGEILPVVAGVVLLGFSVQFNGVMSYIFSLGIPLLFIILYATNLKHLK
jgi:hypothetical protein